MIGVDETEIVTRGMVFGIGSELAALERADGQIEAGRAVLTLVVAVREEVDDAWSHGGPTQDMCHRAVDQGITSATLLVGGATGVADARDHEAVPDTGEVFLV